MAMSITPQYVTDNWTELPKNISFEATSTRLQVLVLNIFQVLELQCNNSFALESDFQEAKRLISQMNSLNAEMEKKLQNSTELHTCKSDQKNSTETNSLKEQLESMKTQLEVMAEDKRHLQDLVTSKEANLTAAILEKDKLERLVQTLEMELQAERKEDEVSNRIFEPHEDTSSGGMQLLFLNNTPQDSHENKVIQLQSVWENLETKEQSHAECLTEKKRLQQLNRNLKEQRASLTEQKSLLEAALNISALNNSILEEKFQRAIKVNERFRKLEQQFRNMLLAQNMINHTQVINLTCSCPKMRMLSAKIEELQNTLIKHNNTMMTLLHTQYGAFRDINFHIVRKILKGKTRKHALIEDAKEGDADAVRVLLSNHVNPNMCGKQGFIQCDTQGFTPLQWAALKGHYEVAEVLLQDGGIVDVDQRPRNCMDVTPLHLATLAGHSQIAQLLLDLGADVNAKTRDGSTPLHLAVKEGNENMVQILLSHGAKPSLRNFKGQAPKDLAVANKHDNIERLLCP